MLVQNFNSTQAGQGENKFQSPTSSMLFGPLQALGCFETLRKIAFLFFTTLFLVTLSQAGFSKTIKVSPEIRGLKKHWDGIEQGEYAIPYAGCFNRFLQSFGLTKETKGKLITYYREERGFHFVSGRVSHFGGSNDRSVASDEKGAITGERLRALDAHDDYYVAMRFDYGKKSRLGKKFWKNTRLILVNPKNGRAVVVRPIDWGPHPSTKRIVDASPATLNYLKLKTDETVWVAFAERGLETGPVRDN